MALSARSIRDRLSTVTGIPYGTREDRHAEAGRSQVARPARRDSSRISDLVSPTSSSGATTPNSDAARWPGRKSFRSSAFTP